MVKFLKVSLGTKKGEGFRLFNVSAIVEVFEGLDNRAGICLINGDSYVAHESFEEVVKALSI